ncbi:MAG: ABC transporter ATP-binding protein [Spirochaetales bacterium]|uniref:ABC transporter ATP-binding protein n=1 Tax=Candidatus Thalassospirochaeta sargassi TaxID=3119039 RepID=A0AAJ1IEE0_9SPIO|nr:ABC transporter ATP-binding protein [Spirochaetales bacterium]
MIHLKNAEFRYGQGFHLKPVSIRIKKATFTVLTGPNGSGKSTLFSLINGIVKPTSGSVTLDGVEVSTLNDRERARFMGMVPQRNAINFDYTVDELVAMGRYPYQKLFSGESENDRKIIDEVIERLDLEYYRNRRIGSLSGGEYQRVLLARVLVQQTDVLLLDEPGNHLDLKHQTMLLNLLSEEVKGGKTVVAVLHDLNQAIHFADYGLLLDDGNCIASGLPREFLTKEMIKNVFDVDMKEYRSAAGGLMFGLAEL